MDLTNKGVTSDFAQYLQSMVKLDALERITQNLDNELADSQRAMKDIKDIFDSIPVSAMQQPSGLRHEDVSKFLDAGMPKLLMEDMADSYIDVDLDDVIASMRSYAEDLKKNFVAPQPEPINKPKEIKNLDLEQYATSLDQLSKRLANIKLSKGDDTNKRNADLETKLEQLCEDVKMFTQMVQSKTALSECNKNWVPTQQESNALYYDNIINKLLSGINDVTYLRQNNN